MGKLLSNETAKQLKAMLRQGVPTIAAGPGLHVEKMGNTLFIGAGLPISDEFVITDVGPFSSGEYGGPISSGEYGGPV